MRCSAKSCQFGARCWGVCGFLSFALAVLWLLLGIWATHLDQRFTPVYSEMTCRMGRARFDGLRGGLFSGLRIALTITTTCSNPNPYSITAESPDGGKVYLGPNRIHVATITGIPRSTLPARGNGSIDAQVDVQLSLAPVGLLTSDQIPLYMDQNIDLDIDVNFLLGRWQTERSFRKKCGFHMDGLGDTLGNLISGDYRGSLGPMACANSFDELTLPNVGDGSPDLDIIAVNVARDEVEKAETIKTAALSAAQGVAYALSGVFFIFAAFCLWSFFRQRKQLAPKPASDTEGVRGEPTNDTEGVRGGEAASVPVEV